MDLDRIQVDARIRTGWQALDLGFLMAQAWFRPLCLAGLLAQLPLALVLFAVFRQTPLVALAILWWLKPFWERLPLFIASRELFGESAGIVASLRTLALKDALPWLLWRRFSPQRAFDHPVTVLEELKGSQRRQRLRILHGKYSDVALANQFVCFCFELLAAFGLVLLLEFFTPDVLGLEYSDRYGELTLAGEWIFALSACAAMTLVIPFHAMAGFALYLNRRIELEAWDIEIAFRRLAGRKRAQDAQAAPGLVLSLLLQQVAVQTMGVAEIKDNNVSQARKAAIVDALRQAVEEALGSAVPGGADAAVDHDRQSAQNLIGEVLGGDDFGRERTVRKWRFRDRGDEAGAEKYPEWLIEFFEWWERSALRSSDFSDAAAWFKLLLILLCAGLVVYLLHRYRAPLSRVGRGAARTPAPEVMFGLDVTPQSLPADVPREVMQFWEQGRHREALGLLYRAALSRLIEAHEIEFRASYTEAECAALVQALGIDSLSAYFAQLTGVWRRLAYGHEVPASKIVRDLCRGWYSELADTRG